MILEARLNSLLDWGYNLGNEVFMARSRACREGYGVRLKAPKGFAKEARLRSCPRIIHVGGYSYRCRLSVDECVRVGLPTQIGLLILNGGDRADF